MCTLKHTPRERPASLLERVRTFILTRQKQTPPGVDCKRSESLFKWSLTLKNSSKANSPFHVLPDVVEGETQPFPDIDITFIHHCSITKM